MSKTHLKAFEIFDGKSQGAGRSGGNWPDLKMWQTHIAICGKSRGNLGKFSCDLWINSCNWPWELKMCHMFLVPVFETASLRTFQLSPHTQAARVRRKGRHTKRERERDGWARRIPWMRDRWLKTEDGWMDRWMGEAGSKVEKTGMEWVCLEWKTDGEEEG